MKLGWFTVYIKGSQVKISKLSVMIVFIILAISADPDGMPNFETFYLSLHCMPKSWFRGFQCTMVNIPLTAKGHMGTRLVTLSTY